MRSSVLQLGAMVPEKLSTGWHLSMLLRTTVPPASLPPQPHECPKCCQGHFPPSYTADVKCWTF